MVIAYLETATSSAWIQGLPRPFSSAPREKGDGSLPVLARHVTLQRADEHLGAGGR